MAVVEIPDKFLTDRQGKRYVLYAGLLDAAHRHYNRLEIDTEIEEIHWSQDKSGNAMPIAAVIRCKVRATLDNYTSTFSGIGDAMISNVNRNIAPHLIRMAETRAKARALRDAVNVDGPALEELGGDDHDETTSPTPIRSVQKPPDTAESDVEREAMLDTIREAAAEAGYNAYQVANAMRRWSNMDDDELEVVLDKLESQQ